MDEKPKAAGKTFRSLEDFDREYFPRSAGVLPPPDTDPPPLVARLAREFSGAPAAEA